MNIPIILQHYVTTKYFRNFKSREKLLAWQDQQVIKLLQNLLPKSPFYRNYYHNLNLQEWRNFPLIDKAIMMANFDQINTVNITKDEAFQIALASENSRDFSQKIGNITVGLSSGTSGNRGIFLVSEKEQLQWAGTILAKALPQSILVKQKIAFFLRANSNLYQTVASKNIKIAYFDLLLDLENHLKKLNDYQPNILIAPPSMLRLLADAKIANKLKINPIKIISIAEVLDPLDEHYLSQTFNQIIHQVYQCTEGFLATTCAYGTLHINEDILVVQKDYLDEKLGKFMPIITDFSRHTQPIIRYRLDDILTEKSNPCPCGSVMMAIESIEGRCDDIFYLKSNQEDKLIRIFPDFIRRAIITASDLIEEYTAIQKNPDLIEISLQIAGNNLNYIQAQVSENLKILFDHLNCQIPELKYQPYTHAKERGKKFKRIRQETINK